MNLNFDQFQKTNKGNKELDNIRIKNYNIFKESDFPSKKQENWKYTDLRTIIKNSFEDLGIQDSIKNLKFNKNWLIKNFKHNEIILLNGVFVQSNFDLEDKKKIKIIPLNNILKSDKNFKNYKDFFVSHDNSLESLNHALTNDGIILEVEDNYSFNKPLVIYNFFDKYSKNKIINNKFFISIGNSSKLNILEYYKAEDDIKYFNNTIGNYYIKKNSILKKFNLNNNLDNSYNYHLTKVKSYSNSIFENFVFSCGPNVIKNEIHCDLMEPFSSCFINGVIFLNQQQQHELKTNINHKDESCKSSQLVKSALLDGSKGTYQGKIYVDSRAQKTNGYQLSKALILSERSEFNSKPELEIYADDVKCSHGSTTGNIDENSIFYLMSRGLSKSQASKMLVEGFLNEVIETITDEDIKKLILQFFTKKIDQVKI